MMEGENHNQAVSGDPQLIVDGAFTHLRRMAQRKRRTILHERTHAGRLCPTREGTRWGLPGTGRICRHDGLGRRDLNRCDESLAWQPSAGGCCTGRSDDKYGHLSQMTQRAQRPGTCKIHGSNFSVIQDRFRRVWDA